MPERDDWLVRELADLAREPVPAVDVRARVMREIRDMPLPRTEAVSAVAALWAGLAAAIAVLAALGLAGVLPSPPGALALAVRGGLASMEVLAGAIESAAQAIAPLVAASVEVIEAAGRLSGLGVAVQTLGEGASIVALALMALTTITMLAREFRRPVS